MQPQRGLSINDRYALAFSQGYNRHHDLGTAFRSGGLSSLENPSVDLWRALAGHAPGGQKPVNDDTALTIAAVYACNRVLADSIASLPIGLFKTTPDGDTVSAAKRPENNLVAVNPSGDANLYTSYTFRGTGQFHLGLRGNFYARIYRDGRGGARQLRILHPDCVRPFFDQTTGKLWYEVSPNPAMGYPGAREILRPDEILHVPALGTDGICGRSPIALLRDTISIGLDNRDYLAKIHNEGGRVRGALRHPGKLSPEQVGDLRTNFKGAINAGEFPILQHGVEFQTISLTPIEAEFINTAKVTTTDIARAYRVPPHMIGDLERATFSNIEHQSLDFVKHTLLPWIKNWEAELNRKLLPVEIQDTHFFRFNVEGMLRGDIKARMEAYTRAIQWGILNRDEVRELENRNRIPDGLGEVFLTPLNMAPLNEETVNGTGTGDPNADNSTSNAQPAAA